MLNFNAKDNYAQENMTLGSGTIRTFVDKKGRWVRGWDTLASGKGGWGRGPNSDEWTDTVVL